MIILCITNAGDIGNHTRSFPTIQHTNRLVSKVCHAFHINTRRVKNLIALTSLQEYRQVETGIRKCIRHTVNELADVMSRAISEDSPFGKALMGRKAGDEVTVEAPKGVIHYRIDSIER